MPSDNPTDTTPEVATMQALWEQAEAKAERRIVEWLRGIESVWSTGAVADAIERGEHR